MTAPVTDWPAGGSEVRFLLQDPLAHPEFAWPRTLLHYPVRWVAPAVRADELRLLDESGTPIPFQLAEVTGAGPAAGGADAPLAAATVCFFADLAPGARHVFTLRADATATAAGPDRPVTVTPAEDGDGDGIVVDAGPLRVLLPSAGRYAGPDLPGPIRRLDRGQGWVGDSVLHPGAERLAHLDVHQVEHGPLFATHRLDYRFTGGARYTATVRVLHGCDFVELAEEATGFDTEGAAWELHWEGCAPTHRFSSAWPFSQDPRDHADPTSPEVYHWLGIDEPIVVGDSGEDPSFSGPGGRERPRERMAFTVGPYAPSYAWGVRPHATFWDRVGGDAMGVFIRDHARWEDHEYAGWASADTLQIRFRHDGVLHWTWPLRTGTRSTGIAFYHHARDLEVLRGRRAMTYQSTYVRHLHHWQGTLSLDRVKDWRLTYHGKRPEPLCTEGEFDTPEQFVDALLYGSEGPRLIANGVNELAGYLNIGQRPLYDRLLDGYDRFADRLDAGQRARVDALLLLTGYVSAGEEIGPLRRMMGGHPNFLADGKAALACLAWLFPEHEAAGEWLDQFEKFCELSGVFHTRPALPSRHARPGRWTESLSTYVWAFLRPAAQGNFLGRQADGRNRMATPEFAALGDWLVHALSAPIDVTGTGELRRLHPAQGAHAYWPRRPPIEMRLLGEALHRYRPLVAEHLMWGSDPTARRLDSPPDAPDPWHVTVRSAGERGTNPRLRSAKYTGYGVTLRAGVDRPDEVAVFLQQVDRGPNYRWGIADDNGNGHLYYYAAGRSYSGHGPEDAGDRRVPDATFATSCAVWRDGAFRGIGNHTLDRPMYDLGGAQYAEITSDPGSPIGELYLGRSVLLVGGDYLVTYDAFAPGQRMVWTWSVPTAANGHDANSYGHLADAMPFIHVVRGVREDGALDGTFATDGTRGVRLEGRADGSNGNTLAVVSHRDDLTVAPASSTPWGAKVRTPHSVDHVFRHQAATHYEPKAVDFAGEGLRFTGTAGVIRLFDDGGRELALFHGSAVGTADVLLTTEDPDLGISLRYRDPRELRGSYDAPGDSAVTLHLLGGRPAGAAFHVDGAELAPLASSHDDILRVALPAGRHQWELTARRPEPMPPRIVRTTTVPGGAVVHFAPVAGADTYLLEVSEDGGTTWTAAGHTVTGPGALAGLADGTKYHVRVTARNADRSGAPGADYPLHATSRAPDPPDGLTLRLGAGTVTATWGEVLGAARYRLYRRRKGDTDFREIFAGLAFEFVDQVPGTVPATGDPGEAVPGGTPVHEYAVAAENGNGLGPMSPATDTDPGSWRHWYPPVELAFRRHHSYLRPPYLPASATPAPYDEQRPPARLPDAADPVEQAW
ncbi:fibronectin type III domain-containing protein [Streptomyces sp. NBC_00448]|uniref:fibronectin type III domain-containing protein n=1 Tax=Streptomyces sp. NBC_00448 TaxID=2903652 RepID=UPI002E1E03C7